MHSPDHVVGRIDAYCDTVPRATAETERIGPFTLFVAQTGWPFYARPSLDRASDTRFTAEDLAVVLARERELDLPQTFEWVHETAPGLLDVARASGLRTELRPTLVLDRPALAPDLPGISVAMLEPDDSRFSHACAAVSAGFDQTDEVRPQGANATVRQRVREGLLRVAGAFDADGRAVGGGTHAVRATASELTGIAVLPRHRGRGIGAAIADLLAADARAHGADLVWLSATDDAVARVYERAGFTRVGTSCEAETPG